MESQFDAIIYNPRKKPSSKCILIGIPMNMYRLQTYDFESELDFFEKAVLRFKQLPYFSAEYFEKNMNVSSELYCTVEKNLRDKGLLTPAGTLTSLGKVTVKEECGLVVNKKHNKIGYVFQMPDEGNLYPYYVEKWLPADILKENPLCINAGIKDEFSEKVFVIHSVAGEVEVPEYEEVAATMIQATRNNRSTINPDTLRDLNIKFIPDNKPSRVLVCTYLYLPFVEDEEYFKDEWQILDPFEDEVSVPLKYYLDRLNNQELKAVIRERFATAPTKKIISWNEYMQQLEIDVRNELEGTFGTGINSIEPGILGNIRSVCRSHISLERSNFVDLDAEMNYIIRMQGTLEDLLLDDQVRRGGDYNKVKKKYYISSAYRNPLVDIKTSYVNIFGGSTVLPQSIDKVILNAWYNKSLKGHMIKFMLSCLESNSNLKDVFYGNVDTVFEIADLRNCYAHGNGSDTEYQSIGKDKLEQLYLFYNTIIQNYISAKS